MNSDKKEYNVKILDHQMKVVFRTQLLVDEDQLMINEYWHQSDIKEKKGWLNLLLVGAGAVGVAIGMQMSSPHAMAISCIPAVIKTTSDSYKAYMTHFYISNFEKLADSLQTQFDINVSSYNYFQRRTDTIYKLRSITQSNTVADLLRTEEKVYGINISINLQKICMELQKAIAALTSRLTVGPGTYAYLINYNLQWSIINSDSVDIHAVINHFNKLYNLYILMSSAFLSCLSLSLCFTARITGNHFIDIQRNVIGTMKPVINKLVLQNKTNFDGLRYHINAKKKLPEQRFVRVVKHHYIHTALQECMRDMQLTFELAHHLCATVELEENPNVYEVHRFLVGLRTQSNTVTEDIAKLLHISGRVVAKTNQNIKVGPQCIKPAYKLPEEFVGGQQVVRYDDPPLAIAAEEYEMYIEAGEAGPPPDMMHPLEDVDELVAQVNSQRLLIEELRQRLKEINADNDKSKDSLNEDVSSIDSSASLLKKRLDRLALMEEIGCADVISTEETTTSNNETTAAETDDTTEDQVTAEDEYSSEDEEEPSENQSCTGSVDTTAYSRSSLSEAVAAAAKRFNRPEETFSIGGVDDSD